MNPRSFRFGRMNSVEFWIVGFQAILRQIIKKTEYCQQSGYGYVVGVFDYK